jgi:hypothetical protein
MKIRNNESRVKKFPFSINGRLNLLESFRKKANPIAKLTNRRL